jgi:hypothetical protein
LFDFHQISIFPELNWVFFLFQEQEKIEFAYLPSNGAQLVFNTISTVNLSKKDAFEMAEDKISEDPRHRVCAVTLGADGKYMMRCWEASDAAEMTFEQTKGKHALLYSRIIFKWKDRIPEK